MDQPPKGANSYEFLCRDSIRRDFTKHRVQQPTEGEKLRQPSEGPARAVP